MRHALQLIETASVAALPILASATDVRELVQYLKRKSAGITVVEASDAIKKRLFDPRKVAAYEAWGIISKSGDRMKLNELGLEFAKALGPEAKIYRQMLDRTPPYRGLLRWIYEQGLDLVTFADIIDYWEEHFPGAIQQGGKASKGHVDTFLQLCQAAEFGLATVERKGQPSRLNVDRDELAFYITGKRREVSEPALRKDENPPHAITPNQQGPERVFISAPRESEIVDSIRNVLGIAEIECEVVERDETLLPNSSLDKMRCCDAGVIIVSDSDQATLIEIGAALSHFGRRVVILNQSNLQLKFHTDELCQYNIHGNELTLQTGLEIIKSLRASKV